MPHLHEPMPEAGPSWGVRFIVVVIAVLAGPLCFQTTEGQRGLLAFCVLGLLLVLQIYSPRLMVPTALVYAALVGGLRRWLIPLFGYTGTDPMTLVEGVLVVLFFANLLLTRRIPRDTRLSRLVLWLLGLMLLEVVNPLQGGLAVGIAGGLFFIVPLLWFYIGRRFGTAAILKSVFSTAIVLSLCAALYGLKQTWFGYNDGELAYLKIVGYGAMLVSKEASRVFSFFTSFAEYAHFLGIGAVLLVATAFRGNRLALVPAAFLFVIIATAGSRGILLGVLSTCTALWAVQGKSLRVWLPRGALAVALAVVGLYFGLHEVQQTKFDSHTNDLIQHQTELLDPAKSDIGGHATMATNGYLQGFRNPLGQGLGATTLAAAKFGGTGGSTEVDISDLFVSLGCFGGLLYLGMIGLILITAFRQWQRTRTLVSLQIIAVLLMEYGQWLHGGNYASTLLIWFAIGAMDRAENQSALAASQARKVAGDSFLGSADSPAH